MRLALVVPAAVLVLFLCGDIRGFDPEYALRELETLQEQARDYAVKKRIEKALIFCRKGRYTRARGELEILKKIDAENAGVYEKILTNESAPSARADSASSDSGVSADFRINHTALREAAYVEGRFERALDHYKNSRLAECRLALEDIFLVDKNNKGALDLLELMEKEKFVMESDRPFQKIVNELFDKGMVFYRREKYADAESMFRQARDTDPANRQVKEYLMKITAKLEKLKEAEETEKMLARADMLRSSGNIKDSRKVYLDVIKKDPENLRAAFYISDYSQKSREFIDRALSMEKEGRLELAYNNSLMACDYDPDNRSAGTVKSRLKVKLAEMKKAQTLRRRANSYYNKGVEYFAKQDYERAVRAWEQVLELTPGDKEAKKNIEKAKEMLGEAREKLAEKINGALARGADFLEQGLIEKAKNEYEFVRRMEPDNKEAAEKIEYIGSLKRDVTNEALDKR
ncbi:MAG TPA: tetratricopeptide repeat protein [Firmicutes bacterium]|nr:tetratricopeptide repeat protein [Bacillota bacterium]